MQTSKLEAPITVKDLLKKYESFGESQIKKWIQKRKSNGLFLAVTKPSKEILIYESKFLEWLESKSETKSHSN